MIKRLYILLLSALLFSACHHSEPFDVELFNEVLYSPRYAEGFEIRRHAESGASLIISTDPWQGAEGVSYKLLIDPNNHFADNADIQRINAPAERILCMSSSHIAMLDALGEV